MDGQTSVESRSASAAMPRACTVALWLALLAVVCATAVILGSFDFRTTRTRQIGPEMWQGHQEGAARWAAWTLLAGVPALGFLIVSAAGLARAVSAGGVDRRKIGRIFALLAAPFLGVAATISTINWMRVLDEQQRATEDTLAIAQGLPVVSVASVVGVGLALFVFFLPLDSCPGLRDN